MRCSLCFVLFVLLAATASSQTPPSETRIKADAREHVAPGATDVTIRGDGERQLNRGVYQYARAITIHVDHPDIEGVRVERYGDIIYDSHGSRYTYTDFRPSSWRYFGLPDPTREEVLAAIELDPAEAFPHGTLDLPRTAELIEGEEVYWHSLERVDVPVRLTYSEYATGNVAPGEIADFVTETEVTLRREAYGEPWTSIDYDGVSSSPEEVGRRPGEEGIPTLKDRSRFLEAQALAAALPSVEAPAFASDTELGAWIYEQFRSTTNRAMLEASIRAVLPADAFVEGFEGVLPIDKQMWVTELVDTLTRGDATFADLTCPTPALDSEYYRRNNQRLRYPIILEARGSGAAVLTVVAEQESGGYRNGQPVLGRWVAKDIDAWTRASDDDLAWLRSFDDTSSICTPAGQAAQAASERASQTTGQAEEGARGTVEGAVREGRRRLGRIFGRGD